MKRLFAALAALGMLCAAVLGACNLWMVHSTTPVIYTLDNAKGLEGDCILVLGCGLRRDGYPSQMLCDRLDVAIEAYWMGLAPKLLMSGDHGRAEYDEVNAMKDYVMAKGVPSEDIFMDHAGFSTYESLVRAKEVFGADSLVIVTQEYHLYRALYIAEKLGMEAVGVPADLRSYRGQLMRDVREAAARAKDVLAVWSGAEPAYLGDTINLSGDGTVTQE
jgi:vancomycin permeability regulator SanA